MPSFEGVVTSRTKAREDRGKRKSQAIGGAALTAQSSRPSTRRSRRTRGTRAPTPWRARGPGSGRRRRRSSRRTRRRKKKRQHEVYDVPRPGAYAASQRSLANSTTATTPNTNSDKPKDQ